MPIYIKFNGPGGEQTHDALSDAFANIDQDFLKLSSATPDTFLKVEADHQIKDNISAIGDWFIKLDGEFINISDVGLKVDDFVLKFTQPATLGAAAVELPAVQSDFLKVDADLKISASDLGVAGSDFIKLDAAPDLDELKISELKVSIDFLKLGTDTTNAGADFTQLGNDLIALGAGPNSKELDSALTLLGDQVLKIGSAFDAVALDFQELSQDFETLGGGGITTTTVADFLESQESSASSSTPTGPLGSDFLKLEQDFHVLNQSIAGGLFDAGPVIGDLFAESGKDSGHPMTDNIGQFSGGSDALKVGSG